MGARPRRVWAAEPDERPANRERRAELEAALDATHMDRSANP